MMKKMKRIAVSLAMALTMLMSSVVGVSASAPTIEEIEHKGNGRIEVEFYGKVKYRRAKVYVKDTSGKKYKVTRVRKDDDDIKFTIKNFKRGKTYKITIKGVKVRGTKKYGKRTGRITIPKVATGKAITGAKALEIAKKHATGTWKASNLWDVDCERDTFRGQKVWEVDFDGLINGVHYEFEYKIAVNGGKILASYHKVDYDD